ncbi:MAG: helix-turn-helix transcriptional regulator [Desulfocapsa sp.]|nr:helix-turn-helix transcriptional regulator [Desulfocapsa sp.]
MKSGIAMVRVSGARIRSLREEQSLTQLYLATAVGVTTETISRWERKGAPTIKEENALKLAESLAVSLQDILAPDDQVTKKEEAVVDLLPQKNTLRNVIIGMLVAGVLLFFYLFLQKSAVINFSAKRLMPAHGTAGHPFPVVIIVDFLSDKSSSLLLKEQLPAGCQVLRTTPVATVADSGYVKWIDKKASGKRTFSYLASCIAKEEGQEIFSFEGTLLVRQSSRQEFLVNGRNRYKLSVFHWADSNKDSSIDDEELLAVYDDYGNVEGLFEDMEEVESIWMGSAYRWNEQRSVFDVIP